MPSDVARLIASLELRDQQFQSAIKGVERQLDAVDAQMGKVGKSAGIGAAAGTFAFNALSFAVANTGNFVGDATRAFIEDEQSVQRLSAALKANVAGWSGNTKAIEDTIKARMQLGFTDDEQRNALGLTVVATGNVTDALRIQATAMDLARLKGISLEEATSKLIKVEGGNFRALKELGIAIDENATQTEALAAVQKAAEGQAAAYAETTGGKLVSAQVRAGEASERLGGVFARLGSVVLPVLADGLDSVLNYIDGLTTAADRALNPLTALLNIASLGQFGTVQRLQERINAEISPTPTPMPTSSTSTSTYSFGDPIPTGVHASGYLGVASSPTRAIYGEAGTEAIAILRNPRAGNFPAPGPTQVVVNLNLNPRDLTDWTVRETIAASGLA